MDFVVDVPGEQTKRQNGRRVAVSSGWFTIECNGTRLPRSACVLSALALMEWKSPLREATKDFFFKFTACMGVTRIAKSTVVLDAVSDLSWMIATYEADCVGLAKSLLEEKQYTGSSTELAAEWRQALSTIEQIAAST